MRWTTLLLVVAAAGCSTSSAYGFFAINERETLVTIHFTSALDDKPWSWSQDVALSSRARANVSLASRPAGNFSVTGRLDDGANATFRPPHGPVAFTVWPDRVDVTQVAHVDRWLALVRRAE